MSDLGDLLPRLPTRPPGPRSRELAGRLRSVESRNVTWLGDRSPVFWETARGANVRDVDGNVYVDLTGGFGVALVGHAHPGVERAVRAQASRLVHGLGDLHPPAIKVELLERLAALAPWDDARVVLANTGSEAVEIALKTALLATGRPGILAFEGAYHGLTLGSLATTSRAYFRRSFEPRLYPGVRFAPFPDPRDGDDAVERALAAVDEAFERGQAEGHPIGALIVEPVQGRAGVRIPPDGFFRAVSDLAGARGAVVIADEVLTGMGRTGRVLASTGLGLRADLLCVGKALGGGLPVSACLGRLGAMEAWPPSPGEALHTSTYLGHPLGCAAALAVLDLVDDGLAERAAATGARLAAALRSTLAGVGGVGEVRATGLLLGIELAGGPHEGAAVRVAEEALAHGLMVLPGGEQGEVVELAPSAFLTDEQIELSVGILGEVIASVAS